MIQNQIQKDSRCQLIHHEQNEYIKVCLNQNCNNRRLCFICFEENSHQKHDNFQDDQIMRMTQFINAAEQIINEKQQQLNKQDNQLKSMQKSFDEINNLFKKFIQTLIQQQDSLKLEIEQANLIIQRLKNKQYNTKDVNNAVDLIKKKNFTSDDFQQQLLRIEQLQFNIKNFLVIKDQQEQKQEIQLQQQLKNNFQQNQIQQSTTIQQNNLQAQNIHQSNTISGYKLMHYLSQEIKCESSVDCAQQSPCGKLLAYAMGRKIVICQINQNQYQNYSEYQNICNILSLKFTLDSLVLVFSDQQGYISLVKLDDNQRIQVQTQSYQIEQLFILNGVKFISLSLKEQQIRITKLLSDSENVEIQSNNYSENQSENDFQSTHCSVHSDLQNSDNEEQEYEYLLDCRYVQSNTIEFDHLGYLSIDFNYNDNLLVYLNDNHVWIKSFDDQKSFKRQIDEYDCNQSLQFKFSQDGKQLACAQNNKLLLYQVVVNQITLFLIKKITLASEIYNLVYNDYYLYCDHGDSMSFIQNQEVSISEDLRRYHKQQDYYFIQQYNSTQIIFLRRNIIVVINLHSQV